MQHHRGNSRNHGREDEHHRHQRRRPPGIGLDGAEDEAHIAVQQKCRRNADQRHDPAHPLVNVQRVLADVARAQRHDLVNHAHQALGLLRQQHDVAPVVEPDLEHQHGHQIPQVNVAEHRHRRGAVRSEVHLRRALRVTQVELQRQRRNQQKRQRREQRQPVRSSNRLDAKDALERRQDKRARHQPRNVGVQNDQHAPIQRDLVGIHITFNAAHKT